MTIKQEINSVHTLGNLPPAQLWIGQHEHVVQEVELFLQKILCPHNGCQTCVTCIHIRDRQHHAIMWFYPEKTYTIEQLDGVFNTIAYSLQPNEQFFFVIQKADLLSTACANRLLKPMEEPPQGYHFILMAEHLDRILPTIISRCIMQKMRKKIDFYNNHPFFQIFTTQPCSLIEFSKTLETHALSEQESIALFNEIFHYWIINNKNTPNDKTTTYDAIISALKHAHTHLPMPGSSSLFWRNLYFQLHDLI